MQEPAVRPGLTGLLDRVCCATTHALGSDGAALTAAELELDVGEGPNRQAMADASVEVYLAQAMVMSALGITLADALVRMRAHALATGRDLPAVAADIVAGRLDLLPDGTR